MECITLAQWIICGIDDAIHYGYRFIGSFMDVFGIRWIVLKLKAPLRRGIIARKKHEMDRILAFHRNQGKPRPRTTKEESGTIREWNQDKDHQKHGGRTRTKSKEEDKGTKGLNCIYVCNVCVSVFVF
eukprot:464152_1